MSKLAVVPRLYLQTAIIWNVFLPWYIFERPVDIIKSYWAYARAIADVFSIVFLLRTLFSPWKSISDEYPDNYFQIGQLAQAFTMNMTARGVGFVVRVMAILFAVTVQLGLLLFFALYLLLWLAFPILASLALHLLITGLFTHFRV